MAVATPVPQRDQLSIDTQALWILVLLEAGVGGWGVREMGRHRGLCALVTRLCDLCDGSDTSS